MRYASWECACPDTALMLVASVQMFKDFYHLPSRAQTGVTSSKIIDYQAGMESIQSFMLTALAWRFSLQPVVGNVGKTL